MKIIELKGHYENQEWVWDTEIDKECNNFMIKLNGDLTPLFYLPIQIYKKNNFINLFFPDLPNNKNIIKKIQNLIFDSYSIYFFPEIYNLNNKIYIFDNLNIPNKTVTQNIIPDWSKYIDKDSAVLFLNNDDASRYKNINYEDFTKIIYKNDITYIQDDSFGYTKNKDVFIWNKKISIILPSIDSKNIEQLNNIAKELKEKYGVEWVQVIATHCDSMLRKNEYDTGIIYDEVNFSYNIKSKICDQDNTMSGHIRCYDIDKITTTNSTGILEVQDTERLTVIDCVEFFE